MRRGAVTWLAWSLVALSVVLFLCGILLSVAADSVSTGFAGAIALATGLPFPVVGAIIAARHPRNAIGWIFCGVGLLVGLNVLAGGYADYWLASGSGVKSLAETAAWFGSWSWIPLVYVPTSFLLLLFPDGRLLSPRWRPVAWCAGIGIVGFITGYALEPGPLEEYPQIVNPYGIDSPVVGVVDLAGFIVGVVSMVASAVSLLVRMHRAGSEQRQQIKWLAYSGAVAVGTIFASGFLSIWIGPLSILIISVALLGLPVFTGIAILRYRLYDIDILINRTLVYGSLTIMLLLVYFGGVVGLQRLFSPIVGSENGLATVATTLAIAALFNPLRRRV
jgi:MFS family permease